METQQNKIYGNVAKAALRRKLKAINAHINKQERSQINKC